MRPPELAKGCRRYKQPYRVIASRRLLNGATFECILECGHRVIRTGWVHGTTPRFRSTGIKCRACAIEATRAAFGDVAYHTRGSATAVPVHVDIEDRTLRYWRRDDALSGRSKR